MGFVTGPHARIPPHPQPLGSGPRLHAQKDEWSGTGERPTPSNHTQAGGAPPGHPPAAPTARKASLQERALWG